VALLVGTEGRGLTDAALDLADVRVRIPMASGVDSLNLSVAAAVALARLAEQQPTIAPDLSGAAALWYK
jgi:tRNA G18 (ribose-2'-O)-methylase SpoU